MREPFDHRIVIAALAVAAGCRSGANGPVSKLDLHSCVSFAAHEPARCGTISLPERRGGPGGRQVQLNVVELPATGGRALAEPILFIHGGPGLAATHADDYVLAALSAERQTHDLLMIDVRGTGNDPSLACNLYDGDHLQPFLETMFPLDKIRDCEKRLSAIVDLTQYTTEISALDLDDIRAALHIDRWSLFGASYGTRMALEYMRRFPSRVVRAALLGVLPPESPIGGAFANGAEQVFDSAFADCSANAACRTASPNLRGDVATLLSKLEHAPATATMWNAKHLRSEKIALTVDAAKEALFLDAYQPDALAHMLQLVHAAVATGDMKTLIEHVEELNRRRRAGRREGLFLSIYCTEDAPRLSSVLAQESTTIVGTPAVRALLAACDVWPHGTMSASFGTRVISSIPTLLMSGGRDPATPLYLADSAAKGLSSVERFIELGAGHAALDEAVRARMAKFFDGDR